LILPSGERLANRSDAANKFGVIAAVHDDEFVWNFIDQFNETGRGASVLVDLWSRPEMGSAGFSPSRRPDL
jgi:hypothetical protein